jgi:peroxiredoxin
VVKRKPITLPKQLANQISRYFRRARSPIFSFKTMRKVPRRHFLVGGIIGAILLGLVIWGIAMISTAPVSSPVTIKQKPCPGVDKLAPNFTLGTASGKNISLSDFRGKVVVLYFWATDCGYDQDDMLHMQLLYDKWASNELEVIAINTMDRGESDQDFAKKIIKFPILQDSQKKVASQYCLPDERCATFLIDKTGIIRANITQEHIKTQDEIENWFKTLVPIREPITLTQIIKDVKVSAIADTEAVITWETIMPSTGQVIIWKPKLRRLIDQDNKVAINHTIRLNYLDPDTKYDVAIVSWDTQGRYYETTTEFKTNRSPFITEVKIYDITESSATISWKVAEPISCVLEYSICCRLTGRQVLSSPDNLLNHSLTLNGLDDGELYWFTISCNDSSGTAITTSFYNFFTRRSDRKMSVTDFVVRDSDNKITCLCRSTPVIILTFWSKSCEMCIYQMKYLQEIHNKLGDSVITVLAINSSDTPETVRNILQKEGITFALLFDSNHNVLQFFKPAVIPTTYFLYGSWDKYIKYTKKGYITSTKEIEDILNLILPEYWNWTSIKRGSYFP